ncbi:hypothetical protein Pcinc_010971 [Petrolisthes cinctipes]|uniref:Uncharacterized protein n=1 Tax=Petrolisthes cinctipes TaxID=88211 RepID=A0AAE1KWV2_PETCI|nr:hypothetical protein Pcinc_010969 [Petrolisthes cinctipes]KAK3884785.1 hypothetical protein Pcinc_010971 [Petrolisthes cinctipes]
MEFIKYEFKVAESEFDCDSVKPAIIQQDKQESQDTTVCTIFVGEDDFIDADLLHATGLPNQQGPHSRAANNSAVVATFEEPTVRYNQERYTPNGAGAFGSHIREDTNIMLSDLLIQEARKRVEHFKNLCQEDEERRASFREKEELDKNILEERSAREELEKNILEEKLASFREKEELEKNCLKLKMQMMRRQMDRFEI